MRNDQNLKTWKREYGKYLNKFQYLCEKRELINCQFGKAAENLFCCQKRRQCKMWTKSSNFSVIWKQVGICLGGQFEQKHIRTYFLVMLHILRKSLWKWNPPATSPPNLSILFYPCKTKMKIGSFVFWSPKCSHWMLKNPLQSDKNNQSAIVSEGC